LPCMWQAQRLESAHHVGQERENLHLKVRKSKKQEDHDEEQLLSWEKQQVWYDELQQQRGENGLALPPPPRPTPPAAPISQHH